MAYGLVSGVWLLLAARILWGASYSMLRLMTQGYATLDRKVMAHRLGLNASVTEAGPILVYTLGAWLVAMIGPRETFVIIGLAGLAALLVAVGLPKGLGHAPPQRSIRAPRFEDLVAFTSFFARSGIFMTTASLLFYGGGNSGSAGGAVLLGSLVLLTPRLFRVLASPLIGRLADRVGIARIYFSALLLDGAGFLLVGLGQVIPGLALLIIGGTSAGMLLPAIAVARGGRETLLDLASNATWSDLGAALGALAGGSLIAYVAVQDLYLFMALALLAASAIEGRALYKRGPN
jgi:predicted MFS family arabinose efflux permease